MFKSCQAFDHFLVTPAKAWFILVPCNLFLAEECILGRSVLVVDGGSSCCKSGPKTSRILSPSMHHCHTGHSQE